MSVDRNQFLGPVTLNGSATVITDASGQTADANKRLSGTSTDLVIATGSANEVMEVQCVTSSSLACKFYGSKDGVSFTPVATYSNGSTYIAADTAVTMVGTANACTLVGIPGTWSHIKISRTAGSGTVMVSGSEGFGGLVGAMAVLSAATINEDTAASDLEILMKGGSVRRDTPATSAGTTGDWATVNQGPNGGAWVEMATLIAGEDLTTNRLLTEQRFSYSSPVVVDTQVKSGAGFLHTITLMCNDAAPTAGSLIVYDNTAESGTVIFNHTFTTTPFAPLTVVLDVAFSTGLYFGFTTTADVNAVASYR